MSINKQEASGPPFSQQTFKDDSRTTFTQAASINNTNEKSQLLSAPADVRSEASAVAAAGGSLTKSEKILTSLLAGAVAGGLAKTVIAPLDRSKIFFQTNETRNYRFRYAIRWLRHGYRTEGFLSLWRGNSATMARILPYAAIQFMSHEQYKTMLKVEQKDTPKIMRFVAGSMAGVTGQLATYPLDKVRAVMAVTNRKGEYKTLVQVVLKIQREESLLALYRGLTPTMLGVILYAGTSFFTYGTLKEAAARNTTNPEAGPNILQRLISGAVAGLLGQTSSYPLDIVRRRMQTGVALGKGNKYSTVTGTILHILRNEGIRRGFYKGLSMNFIKGPIATSISFTTFDYVNMGLKWLFSTSTKS
jgi:solute carrier family 25 protein 42